MENASKALIIAGSILVSIVIITLGVMIVNNVRSTIQDNANLSQQEITTYNSPFLAYEGTKNGTQVRALLDLVRDHNNTYRDDSSRQIDVAESAATDKASPNAAIASSVVTGVKNNIKAGWTYTVSFGYDPQSGLISNVGIVRQQ